jgi:hypothetical protein
MARWMTPTPSRNTDMSDMTDMVNYHAHIRCAYGSCVFA